LDKNLIQKNFLDGPLEIVKGLEDMKFLEDSDAILTVELNKENQDVEWFKDGVKIRSEPKRRIFSSGKVYTLRLNEINPKESAGKYTFRVKDLETSGELSVNGKYLYRFNIFKINS
jgi:hypothetical protein